MDSNDKWDVQEVKALTERAKATIARLAADAAAQKREKEKANWIAGENKAQYNYGYQIINDIKKTAQTGKSNHRIDIGYTPLDHFHRGYREKLTNILKANGFKVVEYQDKVRHSDDTSEQTLVYIIISWED